MKPLSIIREIEICFSQTRDILFIQIHVELLHESGINIHDQEEVSEYNPNENEQDDK